MNPKWIGPDSRQMAARRLDHGNGGLRNGARNARARAKRRAPTIIGGSSAVATLAAALFRPQVRMMAAMARRSSAVRGVLDDMASLGSDPARSFKRIGDPARADDLADRGRQDREIRVGRRE